MNKELTKLNSFLTMQRMQVHLLINSKKAIRSFIRIWRKKVHLPNTIGSVSMSVM